MPDDLPDREHGLRLRRRRSGHSRRAISNAVSPPSSTSAAIALEPCRVERDALVDQPAVVLDRRPVARVAGARAASPASCGGCSGTRASAWRRSSPGSSVGTSSAPEVISARRWSPTNASPASSSTKSVSVALCPGRSTTRSVAAAGADHVAVARGRRRSRSRRCCGRCARRTARSPRSSSSGTPCVAQERDVRSGARARRARGSCAPQRRGPAGRGDRARPSARDRAGEPGVIEVVVREQDELDVLERVPVRRRAAASSAASDSAFAGPVSTSVSGSPASSQTLTVPRYGTGSSICATLARQRTEASVDSAHRQRD